MGNCTSKPKPKHQKASHTMEQDRNRPINSPRGSLIRTASIRKKPNRKSLNKFPNENTNAEILDVPKKSRDVDLIKKYLKSHFLFKALPDEVITQITDEMKLYKFQANSEVFTQGSPGTVFFIVKKGKVEISVDKVLTETYEHGKGFGEVALLQEINRNFSANCLESTEMWGLTREKYKVAVLAQQTRSYSQNKEYIHSVPLFKLLSEKDVDALLYVLTLHTFVQCEVIVNEGDPGELMYFIKSGQVGIYIQGKEVRTLGKGEYFGEQSLLYDTKRTATVIALNNVELLSLGRENLVKVLGGHLENIIYKNSLRIALEKSEYFKSLLKHQIDDIITHVEIWSFNKGDIVIEKKTVKGEKLRLVLKGCLQGDNKYRVFSCIGDKEISNHSQEKFKENIIAKENCVIGIVPATQIISCIGANLPEVISQNLLIEVLRKVPLLKPLPISKLQSILSLFKTKEFRKNEIIFKSNDVGDSLFIVNQGSVKVIKDEKELRNIGPNDFFGERAILKNEPRTATIIASENTICWVLNRDDFLGILDETVKENLIKRMQLQNDSILLTDLSLLCLIGKGQFGSVFLCTDKNKVEYALKTVPRGVISHYDLAQNLILERKILLQLDHPMIIKLVKTFKDENRVCFLMEYVKGQDLFDVLRAINILKESESLFYSACLVLILEYLHSLKIIYRDLKPENVMVNYDGYLKLVDFGISRFLIEGRTYSIIGTPHYMAPEVINGKGYNIQADYWSLGIIIYEMIYCNVPFAPREDDPYSIYEKILERNLMFPERGNLPIANSLIQKLLNSNPSMRGKIENIKEHKWFKGVPWENLLSKVFKPPFIPKVKPVRHAEINTKNIKNFLITYEKQNDQKRERERGPEANWDFEF